VRAQEIVKIGKCLTIRGSFRSRMDHFKRIVGLLMDCRLEEESGGQSRRRFSEKLGCVKNLEEALRYTDSKEGPARYIRKCSRRL